MRIEPLDIAGAFEIIPVPHGDERGLFVEWYRHDVLERAAGRSVDLAQANLSVSAAGVVRGVHVTVGSPGQAKYVTCVRGAVVDVVVDLRVGSPSFGSWASVRLDDVDRRAVFLSEGLGHGFCALSDEATVVYLCSSTYRPEHDIAVHPLDAELAIDWPTVRPVLSPRDAAAPGLAELRDSGALPNYPICRD